MALKSQREKGGVVGKFWRADTAAVAVNVSKSRMKEKSETLAWKKNYKNLDLIQFVDDNWTL